ncbi:AraC family transcriptional regulator [Paenibacillus hodogayensis]|uniref:AraC family transcriptional regulator n=1 Tax=Paenibacillus hodogayensis TaxID=279208 RepID=A0ABV5W684_9BACL
MRKKSMDLYSHPENFPFWIQRNRHDIRDLPALHIHEFVEMVFVVEGRGTHLFQDIQYEIREGDVFIINPGEAHGYGLQEGESIEVLNCLFEPDGIPATLLREMQATESMDFFYVQPFLNKEARFYHKLNLRGSDAASVTAILEELLAEMQQQRHGFRTLIRMKLIGLFILLSRYYKERQQSSDKVSRSEILVQRVRGYVERHFSEKLTLPLLTELFHIGVRQLNRNFHKYVGCSVVEYIHHVRIQKAQRLLVDTDEKLAVVSAWVGYEDTSFFSKLFARKVGCSPGKYREEHRK